MGRSSLAVQGLGHGVSKELSVVNSVHKTCLALKSGSYGWVDDPTSPNT
jgi:hypothetical protein